MQGKIFNIQRFSIHDGPGIRTTVFLQGCSLNCLWCQNPEGINNETVIFRHPGRCLGCRSCESCCPTGAVTVTKQGPFIDRQACSLCLLCINNCPVEALEAAGRIVTVAQLIEEIMRDRLIFEESGGGATFSGGEPLLQPVFLETALLQLKQLAIHTVVETSGCAPWSVFERIMPYTDLFLYDLKLVDAQKGKKYLGTETRLLLDNLSRLAGAKSALRVRMPLIPTVNDQREDLIAAARFLKQTGISELEIIPYHNLGTGKYESLDREYKIPEAYPPDSLLIDQVREILQNEGIIILSEDDEK